MSFSVKKVSRSEAFRDVDLSARMQNEVVDWLHQFCRVEDDCLVIHSYEGDIKIPVDHTKYIDGETGKPYNNLPHLVSDITAALYASMRIMISRAQAQAHAVNSPISGWREDPETGEGHWGYDYINWDDENGQG